MEKIISYFQKPVVRRIAMLVLLGLVLVLLKDMLNIILLTVILAFIMNKLQMFICRKLPAKLKVPHNLVNAILFFLLGAGIILGIYLSAPKLAHEIQSIVSNMLDNLNIKLADLLSGSAATKDLTLGKVMGALNVPQTTIDAVSSFNLAGYNVGDHMSGIVGTLTGVARSVADFALQFFFAYVLSLFILIQKKRLLKFGELFEKSAIAAFYLDCKAFFSKFINTFGIILQNQVIVSTINTVLSLIGLYILGYQNLLPLSIMIFVLGLIPIAGVMISIVPLTIITLTMVPTEGILYTLFGVQLDSMSRLLLLLLLGVIIHTVEAYIISPKLLSDKMKLPIFIVICVLIVCEHYFKIWGLIVGIPIFVFIIDIFGVDPKDTLKLDEVKES